LDLALRCARVAGDLLLERFRGPAHGVGLKSSETDLVSDADRAAEQAIVTLLRAERPEDGILAEEGGSAGPESERATTAGDRATASGRRWLVDPLDGTTNFLYGYPAWSVSVALEDGDGVAVGVVSDPLRGETFAAERDRGARLDDEPITVRDHQRLETALIATGFGYGRELRAEQADALRRILPRVRDVRRGGSAALDLAWLACGRLDGYFERGLGAWDWGAGRVLVAEAGGRVEELPGEPPGLVAAGPRLIAALRRLVA
jgi:myo-inositol-1(or 4)-monophosphatase